jgi:hypothetical protein
MLGARGKQVYFRSADKTKKAVSSKGEQSKKHPANKKQESLRRARNQFSAFVVADYIADAENEHKQRRPE